MDLVPGKSRAFESVEELKAAVGQPIGVSEWFQVTQEKVNAFAEVTGDHQFIHVDPEMAAKTPFAGTIAHGFFTLSLSPLLASRLMSLKNVKMAVNYGLNRVRFPAPVKVGRRIRARTKLLEVADVPGGVQTVTEVTFEVEGEDKPGCVAETIARIYLN